MSLRRTVGVVAGQDLGYTCFIALIGLLACWLLLMPVFPSIASATMHRFHLRSSSFGVFAAQFPIPPMYNFSNRVEMENLPSGLVDPILMSPIGEPPVVKYLNHFPIRVITFSNTRYRFLHEGRDRWFTFVSNYRGQTLTSRIHCKPIGAGAFEIVRLKEQDLSDE